MTPPTVSPAPSRAHAIPPGRDPTYTGAQEDPEIAAPLSLSALSLDIIVALAQRPRGVGASELARIVSGPATTVQSSLRLLVTHGMVHREAALFSLAGTHPAAPEAVALGLRLPPPPVAMRLVIRASDAVDFAVVDDLGFVVATRADADPASLARFDDALAKIRRGRDDVPPVLRFETQELTRILHSAMGLRRRLVAAELLKGTLRAGPSGPGD